jgi:agmatine deiminase
MTTASPGTPAAEGFSMPAEWEPHAGCLMVWPVRQELWREHLDEAKAEWAATARAIAAFEPVLMVCQPGRSKEVRDLCGEGVEPIELPTNDSWARDSGPAFVRDEHGNSAVVSFRFNAWGNRFSPYDDDDKLPARLGDLLGLRVFEAPMVLEGGAYLVDGSGTLLTTAQCLFNPNRNPQLDRGDMEQLLHDYLGASHVVWLPYGHSLDVGPDATDGHIDGIAQLIGPAHVLLDAPSHPEASEHITGQANLAALKAATDASGHPFEVSVFDVGPEARMAYANHYLPNGAVVVPLNGDRHDADAMDRLAEIYPGREIVGVPGVIIALGGGGPHCITQQIPMGALDAR